MRKLFWVIALIPSLCFAEKIMLQWDMVDDIDGYYLYQSNDGKYDYDNPVKTNEYPDGKIPKIVNSITIDLPGAAGIDTKYRFVGRSYRGNETSIDSNEVSYTVTLTPPIAPVELSGEYDKGAGLVKISWHQPPESEEWRTVSHWIVYYRVKGNYEWIPIGRIIPDSGLKMEAPFDTVAEGTRAQIEFVIVAYRRSGVYSQNSSILSIDIDRREIPPIQNLRINIEIPII